MNLNNHYHYHNLLHIHLTFFHFLEEFHLYQLMLLDLYLDHNNNHEILYLPYLLFYIQEVHYYYYFFGNILMNLNNHYHYHNLLHIHLTFFHFLEECHLYQLVLLDPHFHLLFRIFFSTT